MNILKFSELLVQKRGERGIREFARELEMSPATLSRIERGNLPDLETFGKLCSVLKIDPSEILEIEGLQTPTKSQDMTAVTTAVHFKADAHYSPQAAQDLAALILAAQEFVGAKN